MAESLEEKALRLLAEARLTVTQVSAEGAVGARCRGDHALYEISGSGDRWECSCPAFGWCSHLLALSYVVPRLPALPTPAGGRPGSPVASIAYGCTCDPAANDLGRGADRVVGAVRSDDESDGSAVVQRGWEIDADCPVHGEAFPE